MNEISIPAKKLTPRGNGTNRSDEYGSSALVVQTCDAMFVILSVVFHLRVRKQEVLCTAIRRLVIVAADDGR